MAGRDFMDLDRLRELEALFAPNEFAELIDEFLEDAADAVTAIGNQQSGGANAERARLFHYLAGAAQNVGAAEFGKLCLCFERSRDCFGPAEYQAVCAAFRRVWAFFDQRVPPHRIAAAG